MTVQDGVKDGRPRHFQYNGDGLRVSQTLGRFITGYTWDVAAGLPNVLQETNYQDNGPVRSGYTYVYGLGLISSTDGAGSRRFYYSDGLGSTTTVLDGSGAVVSQYDYDVFGELRNQTGLAKDTMLFTGQQYDAKALAQSFPTPGDPGLYYLRAR